MLTKIAERESDRFSTYFTDGMSSMCHLFNYCKDRYIEEASDMLYNDAMKCENDEIVQENIYNIYEKNKGVVLEKALRDFDEWDQGLTELEGLIKKDEFIRDGCVLVGGKNEKSLDGKVRHFVDSGEIIRIQDKTKVQRDWADNRLKQIEAKYRENDFNLQKTIKNLADADRQTELLKSMVHDELVKGEEEELC